ncbi:MAG: quinoprotein dehydrogenase-associated putative ABC transporter substrate-binding protein [Gemmatimonadales bacterium]
MDRLSPLTAGALLLLATATPVLAQRPAPMQPGILRVCADPDNLPNSNKAGEGFENKLAELLAKTWNSKLEYVWWAAPRGMMRMLNGTYCDVWLQIPEGFDLSGVTKPYFRTGYAFVRRADGPDVTSLDDPRLKSLKIGVHLFSADGENPPPVMALSAHGIVGNLVGFSTTYTGSLDRPSDIIQAVVDRKVDIALVWGPIGGYWTRKLGADLVLTPIETDSLTKIPMAYSMGMAVRRRDRELKDSLEQFMTAKRPEILALLQEFGVPLLPLPPDSAR